MAKKNYQSYTLKFGGGYESADFLKHLGFKSKYIDVRSDSIIDGITSTTGHRTRG
jgi:hypothetical protein